MSIFQLSLLFMSFAQSGEGSIIAARAPRVAWAAMIATRDLGPVFDDDEDGFKTASLLVRMAYLETRGDHTQTSADGLTCVGIVQVCGLSSKRRREVLGSPDEGMRGGAPNVARLRCEVLGLCMSL